MWRLVKTASDGHISYPDWVQGVQCGFLCYLHVSPIGVPKRNGQKHVTQISMMALDLLHHVSHLDVPHQPGMRMKLRSGIHTGKEFGQYTAENIFLLYCLNTRLTSAWTLTLSLYTTSNMWGRRHGRDLSPSSSPQWGGATATVISGDATATVGWSSRGMIHDTKKAGHLEVGSSHDLGIHDLVDYRSCVQVAEGEKVFNMSSRGPRASMWTHTTLNVTPYLGTDDAEGTEAGIIPRYGWGCQCRRCALDGMVLGRAVPGTQAMADFVAGLAVTHWWCMLDVCVNADLFVLSSTALCAALVLVGCWVCCVASYWLWWGSWWTCRASAETPRDSLMLSLHSTLYKTCNYLSMTRLKVIQVSQRGHRSYFLLGQTTSMLKVPAVTQDIRRTAFVRISVGPASM